MSDFIYKGQSTRNK